MKNLDERMFKQAMLTGVIPINSGVPVQILWTKKKKDKLRDAIREARRLEGLSNEK